MKTKPAPTPMTILLVEDHDDTREAMKDWFVSEGHTVLTAKSKRSGLALGRKRPFDVLFCDLQLSDGSGWDLMTTLKEDRSIVGIAMSGHCAPEDLAKSKAAGFLTHLIKPAMGDEIIAALAAAQAELRHASPTSPRT